MRLLDVEVERARHRVFARRDGLGRGLDAGHGRDLQAVGVVLVERQAEDADAVRVSLDARQRLGVVAVDVDRHAIGAGLDAGRLGGVLVHAGVHHHLHRAGLLAAREQHLLFEDFAGAVLGARDEGEDLLIGQIGVDVGPARVRVRDHLAALGDLGGQSVVPVGRGEGEALAVDVGSEDDAVIAHAHFDDLVHAVGRTGLDLALAHRAAGIGDVDGVFAHAFAEPRETGRGAARFHHRGREIEVLAKGLGDD